MNKILQILNLIRFHKQMGTLLLFWPSCWGIILATSSQTERFSFKHLKILLIFLVGSFLMRSAGCIINDIFDKDFDKNVERTKNRPLASGKLNIFEALMTLSILLFLSLFLLMKLNDFTIFLGFLALIPVIAYPLTKRVTNFPQVILGLTFNFASLMGYAAIANEINLTIFLVYLAGICWTICYDTIYAFQDIEDDLKIGVKSTTIIFSNHGKNLNQANVIISSLYILMAALLTSLTPFLQRSVSSYVFCALVILFCTYSARKAAILNLKNNDLCAKNFQYNAYVFGSLITIAFLVLLF